MSSEQSGGSRSLSDPETWVEQHGDYLFRCALLRLRDARTAEDLVQETFLAALQARSRFAGRSSERTWLVGILKHKIMDHFRDVSREQPGSGFDEAEAQGGEWFDQAGHWNVETAGPREWAEDPSRLLEQRQFWDALQGCLGELPPRMAAAFSLREIDELESKEVCAALKISPANLWVLLHRARTKLRHCIEARLFRPRTS